MLGSGPLEETFYLFILYLLNQSTMPTVTLRRLTFSLAALLFVCLLDMPYGYYQFVRLAATVLFVVLGVHAMNKGSQGMMILWFTLALLFQPLFKIALGREPWNGVDAAVGIVLILDGLRKSK